MKTHEEGASVTSALLLLVCQAWRAASNSHFGEEHDFEGV
jgi:hypothetical protein